MGVKSWEEHAKASVAHIVERSAVHLFRHALIALAGAGNKAAPRVKVAEASSFYVREYLVGRLTALEATHERVCAEAAKLAQDNKALRNDLATYQATNARLRAELEAVRAIGTPGVGG